VIVVAVGQCLSITINDTASCSISNLYTWPAEHGQSRSSQWLLLALFYSLMEKCINNNQTCWDLTENSHGELCALFFTLYTRTYDVGILILGHLEFLQSALMNSAPVMVIIGCMGMPGFKIGRPYIDLVSGLFRWL